MKVEDLNRKDTYAFNVGDEKLKYIGTQGVWHQFALVERPELVWAEVNHETIHLIKKVN